MWPFYRLAVNINVSWLVFKHTLHVMISWRGYVAKQWHDRYGWSQWLKRFSSTRINRTWGRRSRTHPWIFKVHNYSRLAVQDRTQMCSHLHTQEWKKKLRVANCLHFKVWGSVKAMRKEEKTENEAKWSSNKTLCCHCETWSLTQCIDYHLPPGAPFIGQSKIIITRIIMAWSHSECP